MELNVAIVLVIGVGFLAILGYKSFRIYQMSEDSKNAIIHTNKQTTLILENRIDELKNSNRNYIYKLKKWRDNYELDYDDIDADGFENDNEEFKLSSIATAIYPKLPPSLANLIDKEEFQTAIANTVTKRPEILEIFVNKFLGKESASSPTSNTPQLTERYI